VSTAEYFITGWNSQLRALSLDTGSEDWTLPVSGAAFGDAPGSSNVLAAHDGTVVYCNGFGNVQVLDPQGIALWALDSPADVYLAVLDSPQRRLYLGLSNSTLECRGLDQGDLLWRYDWNSVFNAAEQAWLKSIPVDSRAYRVMASGLSSNSTGVVVALRAGYVISLNNQGQERWRWRADSVLGSPIVFDNAILLEQNAVLSLDRSLRFQSQEQPVNIYPDWPLYRKLCREAGFELSPYEDGRPNATAFGLASNIAIVTKLSALDLDSGMLLDSVEMPVDYNAGPLPAYNMVVGGGGRRLEDALARERNMPRVIQAYDWIEWEGGS
jgi:hypothetical protein